MIADHDHAVAGKELGAFAVGRQERALLAFESLRAVDGHALARHQLGQRIDLALDALGPFGVDVDQTPAGVGAAEPSPSGSSQRCESSWKTTKSSAGEMPITTSRSLPHSWCAPKRSHQTRA